MSRFHIILLFLLIFIRELLGHNEGSGTTMHSSYNEVVPEGEYYTPRLNYRRN